MKSAALKKLKAGETILFRNTIQRGSYSIGKIIKKFNGGFTVASEDFGAELNINNLIVVSKANP